MPTPRTNPPKRPGIAKLKAVGQNSRVRKPPASSRPSDSFAGPIAVSGRAPMAERGVPGTAVWKDEVVFTDGDAFFEALCQEIDQAERTIELESYIFDQDELGKRVLETLAQAAQRGVRVRVLLDGAGASQWTDQDARYWAKRGVEVRFFHPLPWQRRNFKIWQFMTVKRILLGMYKLNHRNHRKCCVIDGKAAYIGSMNVSARHLRSVAGNDAWRDTSVRVEGRSVEHLIQAFDTAFEFSTDYFCAVRRRAKLLSPTYWVRLNHSEFQAEFYRYNLIHSIGQAKKRIWITNPYFVPDRRLLRTLMMAARRGVDVRVVFPHKSDILPVKLASQSFYEPLLRAGVKIYEYLPSILHAKVLLIDDVGIVGSSNLNHRSIYRDLEADVILSNPANVLELAQQFQVDVSHSREIRRQDWRRRSPLVKFLERIFLLFRGIL